MAFALTLIARTRRRVRSFSDAVLLARVALIMAILPPLARLSTLTMLRWLERVGRLLASPRFHDEHDVVMMVRACGGLRRWSFQDNCVSQSLTLFALLNRPDAPLDVIFGVEHTGSSVAGPRLGRRHVWLERNGAPVFEREPLLPYVVQMRYRPFGAPPATLTTSRVIGALGLSSVAAALTTAASLVRTKVVAVVLGPAGIALGGQVSQATTGLGWLATFGSSAGTTRYLAEALGRGDDETAATVVRSSAALIGATASIASVAGVVFAEPIATALFGSADAASMIRWLVPAIPAIGVMSVSSSMLRATQQVARLSAAQSAGALVAAISAFVVLQPDTPASIAQLASIAFAAQAAAVTAAALPLWRRWCTGPSAGISVRIVRGVAAYGAANVVMGLATASAFLYVGRSYLSAGDVTAAARIAALAWFGEPVSSMLASGFYASSFPAYCAATGSAAARVLSNSIRALVLVSAPLLVVGALLAPRMLSLLFDARFVAVAPLLPIQLIATYGRCVSVLLGVPLLARGRVALVTVLHLAWAAAVAIGATIALAGPHDYAVAVASMTLIHAAVLSVVLVSVRLSPSLRDYAWIAGGALPLVVLAWR